MTEKQFEAYAAKRIKDVTKLCNSLFSVKNISALNLSDSEKEALEKLQEANYAALYFSLPFERAFARWERTRLKLKPDEKKIIKEKLGFEPIREAVGLFVTAAYRCSLAEASELCQDDIRENAARHLSEKEEAEFIRFLNELFKPALLQVIENGASGLYRDIKIIEGEAEATADDDNKQHALAKELFKPRDELVSKANEIAKTNGYIIRFQKATDSLQLTLDDEPETSNTDFFPPDLENYSVVYPQQFLVELTKIGKQLSTITDFTTIGAIVSPNTKKWKKSPAISYLTLSPADNSKRLEFSRPITFFDRSIINAVETLAQSNTHITPKTIYQQMNGVKDVVARPERLADIEARIDYMIGIRATINGTAHLNMNGKTGAFIYEDYLLNLAKATFTLNGQTVTGYIYNKESPLFTYARAVNQLTEIPAIMLDTRKAQKGSIRADTIKHYLLSRIFTTSGQGNVIKLDTLLKEIGEEQAKPDQIVNIRQIVEHFLDFWSYGKLKTKNEPANKEVIAASPIMGYSINQQGRKITGYTLIPKSTQLK